jgi:hypothetical protein
MLEDPEKDEKIKIASSFNGTVTLVYVQVRRRRTTTSSIKLKAKVKVKFILRPTASRPICLRVKPHLGPKTIFLLLSDSCRFVHIGCSL